MPDKKKNNSTTDFFLNFMKKEKETNEEEMKKKQEVENKRNKSFQMIGHLFNMINKMMDRMLNSKYSVMAISLILTLVLFFTFAGGDVISSTTSGSKLQNVPVIIEGLEAGYDVSGIPDTVTVGLIGPSLDIYTTQVTKNYEIYVDLSGYKTGTYNVTLKARNFDQDLTVMILPEMVTATISKQVSEDFTIGTQFINEDDLDEKYAVSVESLSKEKVKITASRSLLDRIDHVNALVDVADQTEAFTQTCDVKAYDAENREIDCTIAPEKVTVVCRVDSYSKVIAVKPNFTGKLKKGYVLSNYKLSPSTVTIYGNKSEIADITVINCDVDISNLTGTSKLTGLELNKNDKITKMSVDTIDIELTIEKE